jgi:HAD superfamily hydrolase (TIGR01509 family)
MTAPYSLVIFDCDGVLVDSEKLGIRVLVECAREYGAQMDMSEAMPLFLGRKMAECVAILAGRASEPFPEDFTEQFRARSAIVFRKELQPIPGVKEALARITIPVCVATNGPREKMALSLEVTGLLPYFGTNLFTAYEVGSWKPAPDLYLHTAAAFGVAPDQCAVVEDSPLGIQAAVAAGMTPFGYAPDKNHAIELAAMSAITFPQMTMLPGLLGVVG